METLLSVGGYILAHWSEILGAVLGVATALVGLFMLIPGEQPEKFLQGVVDFLKKFSRK